jgi:hypothetical protein
MKNLWFQFYKIKLEWFQFRFPKNMEPGTLVWFFNQIIPSKNRSIPVWFWVTWTKTEHLTASSPPVRTKTVSNK